MESITAELLLLLVVTAGVAGFIDAIAGGGGLLALPMLLWAGIPPVEALATNKLQGSFGTLTATVNFAHKGHLPIGLLWLSNYLLSRYFLKLDNRQAATVAAIMAVLTAPWLVLVLPHALG